MHLMEAIDSAIELFGDPLIMIEHSVLELEVCISLCDSIVELVLNGFGVTFDPNGLNVRYVIHLVARLVRHRISQHVELIAIVI